MSDEASKMIDLIKLPLFFFILASSIIANAAIVDITDRLPSVQVLGKKHTVSSYHPDSGDYYVTGNIRSQFSIEATLMGIAHRDHVYDRAGWWIGPGYGCMSYTDSAGGFSGDMYEDSWRSFGTSTRRKSDEYVHACIRGSRGFYGYDTTVIAKTVECPPGTTPINSPELGCGAENQPPTLYPISNEIAYEGEPMAPIYLEGEDLDYVTRPSDLRYEVSGLPSWLSYDSFTGRIYSVSTTPYTESTNSSGARYPITATLSDGELNSITRSFTITVRNVNREPTIRGNSAITVDEGGTSTVSLAITDPDLEDQGSLSVTTNAASLGNAWPSWLTVTSSANTVSIQAHPGFGDAGNYRGMVVTVTDASGASATHAFSVSVGNVNRPPEAVISASSGPENATAGFTRVELDASGSSDPDDDELTYTWDVDGTILDGMNVSHVFPDAGIYSVTLTVSDGSLKKKRGQSPLIENYVVIVCSVLH